MSDAMRPGDSPPRSPLRDTLPPNSPYLITPWEQGGEGAATSSVAPRTVGGLWQGFYWVGNKFVGLRSMMSQLSYELRRVEFLTQERQFLYKDPQFVDDDVIKKKTLIAAYNKHMRRIPKLLIEAVIRAQKKWPKKMLDNLTDEQKESLEDIIFEQFLRPWNGYLDGWLQASDGHVERFAGLPDLRYLRDIGEKMEDEYSNYGIRNSFTDYDRAVQALKR